MKRYVTPLLAVDDRGMTPIIASGMVNIGKETVVASDDDAREVLRRLGDLTESEIEARILFSHGDGLL